MSDIGNTVVLCDENDNEVEFEIVHTSDYNGKTYYVLWGEDEDDEDILVVTTKDAYGRHIVADDSMAELLLQAFKNGMDELMDEVDDYAVESSFRKEIEDKNDNNSTITTTYRKGNIDDNPSTEIYSGINIKPFNYNDYIQRSQEYYFQEAIAKYNAFSFDEAFSLFESALNNGNIYAIAHLGIMYHYGEGCDKNEEKAFEFFEKGYNAGCPLSTAWYSECYRMGYGVDKNKDFALKLYKANEKALKELCDADDTAALYFLGYNLIMGIGCEVDESEGIRLLETAVFRGDTRSAVQLAECYLNGWGVSKNTKKAVDLLIENPSPRNRKYNFLLGKCYYYGEGVEKNYTKAFAFFEKAANQGFGKAKDYLGDCYYNGQGTEKNLYEAAKWYKNAVEYNRIGSAAHSLAFMYLNGEGVEEDEKKAIDYFMIAAESGISQAQRIISQEYLSGNILNKDYEAARKWMEKAANSGDVKAQMMLARYYISDFGYDDEQKAFEWFEKAAEQGDAEAEYAVGGCYLHELGVAENLTMANQWFEKAANNGHPSAMYELGVSYIEGRGVTKNSDRGIQYLTMAADNNSAEACALLAELYKSGIHGFKGQSNYTSLLDAQVYAKKNAELSNSAESEYLLASILQESGNKKEAEIWYRNSVNKGYEIAKLDLAKMYILEGTNYTDAVSFLETLSSKNNGEAQYYLAYCLENGYGCAKDKKRAKILYNSAQSNGFTQNPIARKKKFGIFG